MFATLLRAARDLFASSRKTAPSAPTARRARPGLESLEERAVPASFASQLEAVKYNDFTQAVALVRAGHDAANAFNPSLARRDLQAAQSDLLQAARVVQIQFRYGLESRADALQDLAILNSAYNQINRDLRAIDAFFSGSGRLGSGSLLSSSTASAGLAASNALFSSASMDMGAYSSLASDPPYAAND